MADAISLTKSLVLETAAWIKKESESFHSGLIEFKGKNNLVSYVDVTAEKMIVEGCLKILPGSGMLGEEGGTSKGSNEFVWIIDPLDGTTNFTHGVPAYSISLGLRKGEEMVMGIVHDITRDEMFFAERGKGAFMNETKIKVSDTPALSAGLLATGFPYSTFEKVDHYLTVLKSFMHHSHGIRRFGSAALDLAWVACGRFDGFFEYGLNPWDIAAGGLIVQEAGGRVTDFSGTDNFLFGREILASNRTIHEEMLKVIQAPSL